MAGGRSKTLRFGVYVLLGGLFCVYRMYSTSSTKQDDLNSELGDILLDTKDFSPSLTHVSRHLTSLQFTLANCTPPAIEQFPRPIFSADQRRHGVILLHVAVALYMFLGLAIICDEYFVPSLEAICDVLQLESDVAGATFMAAGSSAPELATTVIGVFIAEGDIALGAVVGSAVFNIMFVISICALLCGMVVPLSWWPMTRDCAYYTISIIALVIVLSDEIIMWYESVAFLVLYGGYILIMVFNKQLDSYFSEVCSSCLKEYRTSYEETQKIMFAEINRRDNGGSKAAEAGVTDEEENDNPAHDTDMLLPRQHSIKIAHPNNNNTFSHDTMAPSVCDEESHQLDTTFHSSDVKTHLDLEEDDHSLLSMPDGCYSRFQWVLSLPMLIVFVITVPDCRVRRWRSWYVMTFIMSCVWISALSYIMVWMITIIGFTFHIPDTIMGLTFIAIGASVPDAIASLLVIRDGYGDMAVSNAIGSNVFDILLCLGLPWFIKTAIVNPGSQIKVYSAGLLYSSITLLGTVVFLLTVTHLNGWKLTKRYGVILMVVYVCFMVLASLYELNIFGYVHPPECDSDY